MFIIHVPRKRERLEFVLVILSLSCRGGLPGQAD